ncbi:ribonuclease Z [Geobacter sp. OR-1]|uniref:ribonuclease Z n=1 Tax=Geobacter sp. OR-1 TaxID=1266765 RepID=UPI000542D02A|nr:MBL fold metallo-hydrolase [Geobacter sp. OR-1]GAM10395.1 ribonuclease Z [Geobacter sp. OR-1]
MTRLFRYLEPTYFSGLIDDPCLVIRDRPIHQSIMIDCGALSHVAKREMKPVRAIFVTHAHMDHFMGFDAFLRQVHASPRTIDLFGPPGFADRVEARLRGYDWNLAEPYWCTFMVHEIHQFDVHSFRFYGPDAFARSKVGVAPREGIIYRLNHMEVSAELLDHGIPVLAFRVVEQKIFQVDPQKMAALGLIPGEWMRELKRRFFEDWKDSGQLKVVRRVNDEVQEQLIEDAQGLYNKIQGEYSSASIGYLTDIGFLAGNREKAERLLNGVTLLVGECAFLQDDKHKARSSHHLCTADMNEMLEQIRPKYFLPVHLSKTYLGRSDELYAELSPPTGTTILRMPEHLTPMPLYSCDAMQLYR